MTFAGFFKVNFICSPCQKLHATSYLLLHVEELNVFSSVSFRLEINFFKSSAEPCGESASMFFKYASWMPLNCHGTLNK